jgi:hypothetical protein
MTADGTETAVETLKMSVGDLLYKCDTVREIIFDHLIPFVIAFTNYPTTLFDRLQVSLVALGVAMFIMMMILSWKLCLSFLAAVLIEAFALSAQVIRLESVATKNKQRVSCFITSYTTFRTNRLPAVVQHPRLAAHPTQSLTITENS